MDIFWLMVRGKLPCMFQVLTGLYCPGCGGTRAVKALLTGHPVVSFFYHPVVLYGVLTVGWLCACRLLFHITGRETFRKQLEDRYLYIGLGIIAVNFVIKNLLLVVWNVDVLNMLAA